MPASQLIRTRCAPLVALLAAAALTVLAPTASAAAPQGDRARAVAAPPMGVSIRISPNFKFVDDAARTSDEFAPPSSTETVVNLFPVFIFLLVVGAVCLFIAAMVAHAKKNE